MKILLLSDSNSAHTIRWSRSLTERGLDVAVFCLSGFNKSDLNYERIKIYPFGFNDAFLYRKMGSLSKVLYIKALPALKSAIREFKPDIVHAHYASSYGILGALSNFHPYIVSVWGSDVYNFPRKSFIHKAAFKYPLRKADRILSTSKVMAGETRKYTDRKITVTPFGIDLGRFQKKSVNSVFSSGDIVVGTVKRLEEIYGIEFLIRAFKIVKDKFPEMPVKLLIVGGGSLEKKLKELASSLGISGDTIFTGRVPYDEVPEYHNMLDIYVTVSLNESFGVAILEASACERPVVVSNVGGLPDVVEDGITGFIVQPRDPEGTAAAIIKLLHDKNLRERMGKAGRETVKRAYDWDRNVNQMIEIYNETLSG